MFSSHWLYAYSILRRGCHHVTKHTIRTYLYGYIIFGSNLLVVGAPKVRKAQPELSSVFSAPLPAWRNLFSATGIFCSGRYQPGYTRIFWLAEGTSQLVTISKKWKNPSSALRTKRTWAVILDLFSPPTQALLLDKFCFGDGVAPQKAMCSDLGQW